MSQDTIREAERYANEHNDGYVAKSVKTDYDGYRDKLQTAIVNFKIAKSNGNDSDTTKAALDVIQYRTYCMGDGLLEETNSALSAMKYYQDLSDKKNKEIVQLKKDNEAKIKEMQTTIDGLYEQVGIAKGMYQECAKRIEQMIERAGMGR